VGFVRRPAESALTHAQPRAGGPPPGSLPERSHLFFLRDRLIGSGRGLVFGDEQLAAADHELLLILLNYDALTDVLWSDRVATACELDEAFGIDHP